MNGAIRAHAYIHWVPNCRSGDIGRGWRLVANIAGVFVVGRRRHLPHLREKYVRLLIRTTMMRGRLAVVGRGGDLFGIRVAARSAIDISDDWVPGLTQRLVRVWCWFWSVRGCGGFVSLCLFGSRSVSGLAVAVVSLALVFGSRSVFVLVIGRKRGRKSGAA